MLVRRIGTLGPGHGQFNGPEGICLLSSGHLAVIDSSNHRVVILRPEDGEFLQVIGGQGLFNALSGSGTGVGDFNCPAGICVLNDGSLAVCDLGNNRIVLLRPVFNGEESK